MFDIVTADPRHELDELAAWHYALSAREGRFGIWSARGRSGPTSAPRPSPAPASRERPRLVWRTHELPPEPAPNG